MWGFQSNYSVTALSRRVLVNWLVHTGVWFFVGTGMLLATMNKLTSSGSEAARRSPERPLSFAERVTYQRAVEEVYWHHRIWPKDNPQPKPPLDAIVSQAQLEKKVEDYLRKSQLLA